MYLKSIEIQGFKSFANKTVLRFGPGLTGIVGPNGSGKSNVADAVRWVLGEQKIKQLRGASMQDVIFAGTELRKPQGFAFVAITLDNADHILPVDYAEVTVSRRLYRSGESEYMINGQQVRLRDVQELFYDTGIGKEGYSIIGQGQVESILNGKPEERRGIFDEACGIVKFKRRKQAAEHKLETERANLVRVGDILSELSGRVEPLRVQAEAAREFLKLRDRLRLLDLNLFIREQRSSIEELKKADEGIDIAKASLSDLREEDARLKAGSDSISGELTEIETRLDSLRNEASNGRLAIESIKNRIAAVDNEIELKRADIAHATERMKAIDEDMDGRKAQAYAQLNSISELKAELRLLEDPEYAHGISSENASAAAGLSASERGMASSDDVSSKEKAELLGLLNEAEHFSDELAEALGISREELGLELSRYSEGEEKKLSEDKETETTGAEASDEDEDELLFEPDWIKAIKQKRSSLTGISEKEERLTNWLRTSEEEYNQKTLEIKSLNRDINNCQQDYHTAASRLETLKNIAERYEGYGQSIKSVMQRRSSFKGIRGVVADLIHTKASYETAIETALGGSIQNIVTDTEATAKDIIEFLKRGKLGRATFLPLDAIKDRDNSEYRTALKEQGAIGLASDIVEYDEEYKELVGYLLGRTLVCEDMQSAFRIAGRYSHRLRIVTLQGELLSPGGSISGGAYKNSSNLLGRQREIEGLKKQTEDILRKIDGLNEKLVAAEKSAEEMSSEIDDLRSELSEVSIEKNRVSLEIISEFRLKLSGISQKAGFVTENLRRLISEIRRLSSEREQLLDRRAEEQRIIELRGGDKEKLLLHIEETEADIKKAEEQLSGLSGRKAELTASQKEYFQRKDEISTELLGLEKELLRLENGREKLQQKLDERAEHIWTEYELTQSEALSYEDGSLGSDAELRSELVGLRKRTKELGPVNIGAIDEYKEVSERYEFLKAQYEDLTASEASILSIIDELDKGMKKQFAERFAEIRKEFDRVFKELFGGGSGSLELSETEDGDELSAGIVINAQPTGKKLQNMMQLSGGEKTLTAIALLFAIQELKPSPFCLLDEIEAALDDSNIDRFAAYLRKLTDRTQFIVITHRRGTMEACDRLYGITMQEKGVTALVSVDLVSDSLS